MSGLQSEPLHPVCDLLEPTPGAEDVRRMKRDHRAIERHVRGRPCLRRELEESLHTLDPWSAGPAAVSRRTRALAQASSSRTGRSTAARSAAVRRPRGRTRVLCGPPVPKRRAPPWSIRRRAPRPRSIVETAGEQDLCVTSRAALLQQLGRYAVREAVGAKLRIEDLSERHERLTVARHDVVALVAIRKEPVRAHGAHAAFLRFGVS